ncbi:MULTISPECIES: cytochrome b562 [Vibrio]|uniref:Soluble cytochrome b562 n=2 Tax=Vibrio TaxID=662 RepID=A0A7X4LHA3_9VIBR|nr:MULTISPECIES: cytochrome b562 [Vibrio]MBF9003162.1 hypothetical protein [Vibrio nitrifigilis]MZI91886.1 hypothetical protein [Vibrio eleionomae]
MIKSLVTLSIGILLSTSVFAHGELGRTMKQMKSALQQAYQAQTVDDMKVAMGDMSSLVKEAKRDEYEGKNPAQFYQGLQDLTTAIDGIKVSLNKGDLNDAKLKLNKIDALRKEYHKKTR